MLGLNKTRKGEKDLENRKSKRSLGGIFLSFRSFTAKRQETAKVLIFLLLVFALNSLMAAPAAAKVTEWEVSPENPVVGDTIWIRGEADPDEEIEVLVSFEKEAEVLKGKYEYHLKDVVIPGGFKNRFIVEAKGAENLNVRVKILLWVAKSAEAKGATATVSQSSVPPGTYPIKIDGKAKASSVDLKITALQTIKADSEGKLSYSYKTNAVPPGKFEIKLGGITKEITLDAKEKVVPLAMLLEEPPEALEEKLSAEGESNKGEEKLPSPEGISRKEELFKNKIEQKNLMETENTNPVEAEGKEDKKEKIYYTLGGIASALILLFAYSKLEKNKTQEKGK